MGVSRGTKGTRKGEPVGESEKLAVPEERVTSAGNVVIAAAVAPDGVPMQVPAHGNGLLKRGGSNPGAGRPPNKFRRSMRKLADNKRNRTHLKAVLEKGPEDEANTTNFWKALEYATDQGYGKAPQQVELGGSAGFLHVVGEVPGGISEEAWAGAAKAVLEKKAR